MSADLPTTAAPLSIEVSDLVVDYELFTERRMALRERFVTHRGTGHRMVRALKGVSFKVYEGEAIGVVGSNGSGKSTLFAAIAGLQPITSGQVRVSDEPRLMGVGAALMPKISGRRNIRLGLLALGMSSDEADEKIESIVEFTELGEAINRPLSTYSSGMRARLHFAIATAITPRILLIDEALAVGDKDFRRRSQQRIDEMLVEASTLMLVSHSLGEVRRQCTRALWIEDGELLADGPVDEVVSAYEKS